MSCKYARISLEIISNNKTNDKNRASIRSYNTRLSNRKIPISQQNFYKIMLNIRFVFGGVHFDSEALIRKFTPLCAP
jgi:hypothetical protein